MRSASVGPSTSSITSAWTAARLFEAVDLGDVRVIEGREHLRFAAEARHAVGIVRHRGKQDLDRDVAIQLRVAGPVDLAHAACPERRFNLVRADASSSGQGHAAVPCMMDVTDRRRQTQSSQKPQRNPFSACSACSALIVPDVSRSG